MNALKKQARLAGLLYTLVAFTAPIGLIYVPNKLFVSGDASATADQLRASESLLRLGMASELFHQSIEVFMVLILYALFEPVSKSLARQMAILGFIPIPIVFVNVLNEVAALTLVSGTGYLAVFDKGQLDALAMLFVRLHSQGLHIAAVFWGLWLFPFGLLVVRCKFIPAVLGILVMIAGTGYLLEAFTSLLLPQYFSTFADIAGLLELGEPPIILWLLIWGARPRLTATVQ
jgi:hypothetical protein